MGKRSVGKPDLPLKPKINERRGVGRLSAAFRPFSAAYDQARPGPIRPVASLCAQRQVTDEAVTLRGNYWTTGRPQLSLIFRANFVRNAVINGL